MSPHAQLRDVDSPSPPEVTTSPSHELAKREALDFLGYTYYDGSWVSVTCYSGATFTESKPFGITNPGYAACLSTGQIATGCTSGTLYYPSSVLTCNPGYSCVTGIVATSSGAEFSGDLDLQCNNILDWVIYKTPPTDETTPVQTTPTIAVSAGNTATQTTVITSIQIAAAPTGAEATASNTGAVGTTDNTAGAASATSASSTPTASHSSSKGISGAAIAGAVAGPICSVALILGLAFLFLRRRHNNDNNKAVAAGAAATGGAVGPAQYQSPQPAYPSHFGGISDGKEAAQVHMALANPHTSIPPGYANVGLPVSPVHAGNPPNMHQLPTNSPPPFVAGHHMPPSGPPSGPTAAELGTNPQSVGMPPELPAYPR